MKITIIEGLLGKHCTERLRELYRNVRVFLKLRKSPQAHLGLSSVCVLQCHPGRKLTEGSAWLQLTLEKQTHGSYFHGCATRFSWIFNDWDFPNVGSVGNFGVPKATVSQQNDPWRFRLPRGNIGRELLQPVVSAPGVVGSSSHRSRW